ncbi:28 kDa heat- and acid-stable phosphoprotein [Atheta coriaria]|uniref:28 kDa heat- and acid-stable phosphoprotein n=1 Tax=Dalotia coriaria TaxID=877792 RepID=UPI0031F432F4
MPRKFVNHKGRHRKFTNPEELEQDRKKEEEKRRLRAQRGVDEVTSSEEEDDAAGDKGSGSESEESSSEEEGKAKGVSNLIEIENPNRVQKKTKKVTNTTKTEDLADKPQLSRREREEIEKQRARAHYQKLHAEGKTEEARSDLARLAIIKQQREDAQRRREEEKKVKEDAVKQKTAQTQKALGKK